MMKQRGLSMIARQGFTSPMERAPGWLGNMWCMSPPLTLWVQSMLWCSLQRWIMYSRKHQKMQPKMLKQEFFKMSMRVKLQKRIPRATAIQEPKQRLDSSMNQVSIPVQPFGVTWPSLAIFTEYGFLRNLGTSVKVLISSKERCFMLSQMGWLKSNLLRIFQCLMLRSESLILLQKLRPCSSRGDFSSRPIVLWQRMRSELKECSL